MKTSLRSLLVVTVIILFGLSSAWIYVRQKGLAKPISPLQHPFFTSHPEEANYLVAYRGASLKTPPSSLPSFERAAHLNPRLILWADVQMTSDSTLVIWHDKSLSPLGSNAVIGLSKYKDIADLDLGLSFRNLEGQTSFAGKGLRLLTLPDFLARFPEHRVIVNVVDYRPGLDAALVKVIDEAKAGDRVMIQSDQDGILRDIRALRPLWLFGISQAQLTQLRMLLSIGLGPIAPLKGDVLVAVAARPGRPPIDRSMVDEGHRRQMKVFAGPVNSLEEMRAYKEIGIDGLITQDPETLADFAP